VVNEKAQFYGQGAENTEYLALWHKTTSFMVLLCQDASTFMKSIRAGTISTEVEAAPAGQGGVKIDEACGGDLP
jgi:hypothetical protein